MEKPRQIAFSILKQHLEQPRFLEEVIAEEFAKHSLAANDRALIHEITGGVVRWRRTLDWLIDWRTRGRAQQPIVQILLSMGFYQLLWLERVPAHAAVHETVEIAKSLGLGPIAGFINAICRGLLRDLEEARRKLTSLADTHPDIRWSHPQWIAERWENIWGRERVRVLMEWNNQPPPVYVRVNRLLAEPAALEIQWAEEGVVFKRHSFAWAPDADIYQLVQHPSLSSLKSLQEGRFYVQDPSTLLAVQALDVQPGMTILDTCAAPGGKTTFIAQRMQNQGVLIAQDTYRARIELIRQNCERLGVRCVQISTHSGVTHPELSLSFDRILVDAPCSNTGVMRRRVDLRWRVSHLEIQRLQGVQQSLVENASTQLKPGGLLVYSTCSLEVEENQQVTQWFLRHHPEFESVFSQQLTPFEHGVDGAYVTVFRKRAAQS